VVLYSEIGDDGYETRKVDVYRDGRLVHADERHETGTTILGEKPTPGIDEIAAQAEFSPVVIDQDEFEEMWSCAHG
jgi:hypothetical protein